MWTFTWLESVWHDLRQGLRTLRKDPGFTAVAIITLALGIGANTAMFSVVNAVLIRPLPYAAPGRLVSVSDYFQARKSAIVTDPDFTLWKNQNQAFTDLAAYGGGADYNLTGQGRPQRVTGWAVTATFLPMLGIRPFLGRNFLAEEDLPGSGIDTSKVPVVIITHRLWDRLGSPQGILGKRLMLDGAAYTVIGVLPVNFRFPAESQPDLLRPLGLAPKPVWDMRKPMALLRVIGRLKPGISIGQAAANIGLMNRQIVAQLPPPFARFYAGVRADVMPLDRQLVGNVRSYLLILLGAVGFVLLIACVNVANLQLEHTTSRRKEIAVRMAIGAGRGRVIRRLLTESLLIAVAGSVFALAIAYGAVRVLRVLAPHELPNPAAITLDPWVLVFTLALAVLATILFGLAPAIQAVKTDLNQTLKETGQGEPRSHFRLRNLLAIAEVALAVVLVAGSGLLIRSFSRLMDVDPGFNPGDLLTAQTWLPLPRYSKPEQQITFLQDLLSRVKAQPGVTDAAGGTGMPFSEVQLMDTFFVEGQPALPPAAGQAVPLTSVSVDYFSTLQIPLVLGRFFTAHDAQGSLPVVIINLAFVRRFLNGQNALGKRIRLGRPTGDWSTIVGVVGNVHYRGLDRGDEPLIFTPYCQGPAPYISLLVRTASNPVSLAASLRAQVQAVDKNQPVFDMQSMQQRIDQSLGSRRFNTFLLTAFALLGLVLAAVGLYGVISYSVTQRTHEIGIRMALGAQRPEVLKMVLRHGLFLAVAGVTAGLAAATGLTRLLASLLYGVKPLDTITFALVPIVLIVVALLASYIPARRATKVNPTVALRHE